MHLSACDLDYPAAPSSFHGFDRVGLSLIGRLLIVLVLTANGRKGRRNGCQGADNASGYIQVPPIMQ
jgi:hypothetical protein